MACAIQSQSQLRTGNPSQWNQSVPGQINPTLFSKSRTLSPLMPRTRFESFIVLSARCPDGVLRQYLVRYSLSLGKPLECFLNNQARRSRVDPLSWGQYGGTKDSSYSFQYLRRPGCAAKLLCFHIVSGFESHRLHWKPMPDSGAPIRRRSAKHRRKLQEPGAPELGVAALACTRFRAKLERRRK